MAAGCSSSLGELLALEKTTGLAECRELMVLRRSRTDKMTHRGKPGSARQLGKWGLGSGVRLVN